MSSTKPANTRQSLKEAEIYVQQGLFKEAAGIYRSLLTQCREALRNNEDFDNRKPNQLRSITRALERRLEIIEKKSTDVEKPPSEDQQLSDDLPPETLIKRAVQLKSMGFYIEAIKEFEKASQISPELSDVAFEGIAEVFFAQENTAAGIDMLRKALALVKDNPEKEARLLERIAGIHEETGDKPEALAAYKEIFHRHSVYNRIFRKIEELTAQLARTPLNLGIVCRNPKLFFTITLLFGLFFIAYNPFVKTLSNVDYYTLEDNPEIQFYNEFKTVFGNDEFFIIAFENDNIFAPHILEMIQDITMSIEELDDVDEVTSITNVNEIYGDEDYFEVRGFLEELPETGEKQAALKKRALENPLYTGNIISKDGRCTAIIVRPFIRAHDEDLRKRVILATKNILQPYEAKGTEFHLAGWTTTNYSLSTYLNTDTIVFIPLTYLLITLTTWLIFRDKKLTLAAVINITICVGATRGLMGLLGITVNNITTIIIPLVMALALCDTVHIFSHLDNRTTEAPKRPDVALTRTLNRVALPCFLTTVTTAIGFISLLISEIGAIQEFAIVASAGMVFEFIFSFFFLPPLLLFLKKEQLFIKQQEETRRSILLQKCGSTLLKRYPIVLIFGAVIIVLSAYFTSQIRVETDIMNFFKKSSPVRASINFVETHLTGTATLDVSFKASTLDIFKEPENLRVIESVQNFAQNLPGVEKTISLVDFIKDMNQSFHSEAAEFYRIPDSRELIAQYLLLYDSDDIEDFINPDFDNARLAIRTSLHNSNDQKHLITQIRAYIDSLSTGELAVTVTGRSVQDVLVIDSLVKGQVYSLSLAAVVISVTLLIVFRSLALAALSLIPNLFPILLNFGVMGVAGIPLDTGTSLIAAVALGIAVDDTIHFLSEYQQRRAQGLLVSEAIMHTIDTKGRAILSSSLILCIGFGVMVLSRFVPVIHFGLLCAVIMITAVIGDLVLLPAVILLKREKGAVESS